MEEWLALRRNHAEELKAWATRNKHVFCADRRGCAQKRRFQRDRERHLLADGVDAKANLLQNVLDSIHSCLFHSHRSRRARLGQSGVALNDDEQDETVDAEVWTEVPDSVSGCNVEQIVSIVEEHIFGELRPNIAQRLLPYKAGILEFIKVHSLDGAALTAKSRKPFADELKAHLQVSDTKMRTALCVLYTAIIKHDLSLHQVQEDEEKDDDECSNVWAHQPQSIEECSVEQIIWLLKNRTFQELQPNFADKLEEHKQSIIAYFESNSIDGNALLWIDKKEFLSQMNHHLQLSHNRLNGALHSMRRRILLFDVSSITHVESEEEEEKDEKDDDDDEDTDTKANSKFVTEVNSNASTNYSFGVAFKYTANLRRHPLFVAPKYDNMQRELIEYFLTVNKDKDLAGLRQSQSDIVASMSPLTQSIARKLIVGQGPIDEQDLRDTLCSEQKVDDGVDHTATNKPFVSILLFCSELTEQLWPGWAAESVIDTLKICITQQMGVSSDHTLKASSFISDLESKHREAVVLEGLLKFEDEWVHVQLTNDKRMLIFSDMSGSKLAKTINLLFGDPPQVLSTNQFSVKSLSFTVHKGAGDARRWTQKIAAPVQSFEDTFMRSLAMASRRSYDKTVVQHLDERQMMRLGPFIEQRNVKMNMPSMKQNCAVWYCNLNEHHQIHVGSTLNKQHVLSLIMYSQCSAFCTAFRGTYRKLSEYEGEEEQKRRHSEFAHFGRAIYESFVFFASTESQIQLLYHGVSIRLLFANMYCTFAQPTSTTTEHSVAGSFGRGNGLVVKLQSADSDPFIRTMDMAPFTCFHQEDEHLIFETRCQIKDIFIQCDRTWIGLDQFSQI